MGVMKRTAVLSFILFFLTSCSQVSALQPSDDRQELKAVEQQLPGQGLHEAHIAKTHAEAWVVSLHAR